jgi:hypothetical protein
MKQPKRQKQQEKLQDLIRDLERDLSEGKSQVAALEDAYKRLEESERLCQELADENRRLLTENTGWRERSARHEENLSTVQQQLETLQAQHETTIKRNRELEDERTLVANPQLSSPRTPAGDGTSMTRHTAELFQAYVVPSIQVASAWLRGNSRVAWACACVVVLVGAAATALGTKDSGPSKRLPVDRSEYAADVEHTSAPMAKPMNSTAPRIRGAFQTVRSTIVYSRPAEDAEIVAQIGKGTRVNVVNARNGWLEIHSKHGRPPGFIRQEAAERIASN